MKKKLKEDTGARRQISFKEQKKKKLKNFLQL